MKELEIELRIRNNRLKERREALGMTRKALARATNITPTLYGLLEAMKQSPLTRQGKWREAAKRLADFHKTLVEDLFPDAVLRMNPEKLTASRRFNAEELGHYIETVRPDHSRLLQRVEKAHDLEKALVSLKTREQEVVRARFGFDGPPLTLEEAASRFELSREMVRQIEVSALEKLRAFGTQLGTPRPDFTPCRCCWHPLWRHEKTWLEEEEVLLCNLCECRLPRNYETVSDDEPLRDEP